MAILISCLGIYVLHLTLYAEIFPYAFRYFILQIPVQIMLCLAAPFFAFYSGRSRTIVVSSVNIFATLLNILLYRLLIFGHLRFQKLGITGAGMAIAASQSLASGIYYPRSGFVRKRSGQVSNAAVLFFQQIAFP